MIPNISIYSSVKQTKTDKTIPFDLFLERIRDGYWQDIVLPIRTIEDKEERAKAKQKAPSVTISGTFSSREDKGLTKPSGFIAIDIDNVEDTDEIKSLVCTDPHVYAAFVSISGRGLCLIFKITPARHREAFQGISEYLYNTYRQVVDPTSINVSRLRFVSFDPHLYLNENAERFAQYPKNKPPKKVEKVLYAQDDFSEILDQIVARRLNLCENYHEWLRIAFAFVHHFGEGGRDYFHLVSQYSSKYDAAIADKQYTACLRHRGSNQSTIATFYYYCKAAGVRVYSERTRKIAYSAASGKKAGLSAQQVAANLEKFEEITGAEELVKQVMDNDVEVKGEDSFIVEVKQWLSHNYALRRNAITRKIECDGEQMQGRHFNNIFVAGKEIFEKLSFEMVDRIINSDFTPTYNPLLDFFSTNNEKGKPGTIEAYIGCFRTADNDYFLHFFKKWLVGLISAAHGQHCPLMMVYVGRQGNGKTRAFRDLLPLDLRDYFAESKLDLGKDDEIMMTQKWIIMDDEMGGKNKRETTRLKELTSKQTFTLREPYGRANVDLQRLAVLCGTTNDPRVLNDPTGNRRIIPVEIEHIDYKAVNAINRVDLLMEAYHLYKSGEYSWELSNHDVAYLNGSDGRYQDYSLEYELLDKYYEVPRDGFSGMQLTATEIKIELEKNTQQKLSLNKIGSELQRMGFKQDRTSRRRFYTLAKRSQVTLGDKPLTEELPF